MSCENKKFHLRSDFGNEHTGSSSTHVLVVADLAVLRLEICPAIFAHLLREPHADLRFAVVQALLVLSERAEL